MSEFMPSAGTCWSEREQASSACCSIRQAPGPYPDGYGRAVCANLMVCNHSKLSTCQAHKPDHWPPDLCNRRMSTQHLDPCPPSSAQLTQPCAQPYASQCPGQAGSPVAEAQVALGLQLQGHKQQQVGVHGGALGQQQAPLGAGQVPKGHQGADNWPLSPVHGLRAGHAAVDRGHLDAGLHSPGAAVGMLSVIVWEGAHTLRSVNSRQGCEVQRWSDSAGVQQYLS